jgi:hypothetical protein
MFQNILELAAILYRAGDEDAQSKSQTGQAKNRPERSKAIQSPRLHSRLD